jgi:hypothetical protein
MHVLAVLMREFIPSLQEQRSKGIAQVERPLPQARSFREGVRLLRDLQQDIVILRQDLGGDFDPTRMLASLQGMYEGLMRTNISFATQIVPHIRPLILRTTAEGIDQFMPVLLAELAFFANQEELASRRGVKDAAAADATEQTWADESWGEAWDETAWGYEAWGDDSWEEAWDETGEDAYYDADPETAALQQKGGKGKAKGKGKKGKGKPKGNTSSSGEPCPHYLQDDGCKLGGTCSRPHPRKDGKCLRCGSTKHLVVDCPAPRYTPKGGGKNATKSGGKSKGKGKGKKQANQAEGVEEPPEAEAAEQDGEEALASLETWMYDQGDEEPAEAEIHPMMFASVGRCEAASASEASSLSSWPLLDTGASHTLLPFTTMTKDEALRAKKLYLRLAAGKPTKALIVDDTLFAVEVSRWLFSVGQLRHLLGISFAWGDRGAELHIMIEGVSYLMLRAKEHHNLPLVWPVLAPKLLEGMRAAAAGKPWTKKLWEKKFGYRLDPSVPQPSLAGKPAPHLPERSPRRRQRSQNRLPPSRGKGQPSNRLPPSRGRS